MSDASKFESLWPVKLGKLLKVQDESPFIDFCNDVKDGFNLESLWFYTTKPSGVIFMFKDMSSLITTSGRECWTVLIDPHSEVSPTIYKQIWPPIESLSVEEFCFGCMWQGATFIACPEHSERTICE